jgi:CheY-like chemotaxis protein
VRVLVVEDEVRMAGLLRRALKEEGHAVDVAADGPQGLWLATENEYGAIVLDVMLPGMDGFQLCRRLRESGAWAPVLMLTARDGVTDRVRGLDAGADDYRSACWSWPRGCGRWPAGTAGPGRRSWPRVICGWTRPASRRGGTGSSCTCRRRSTACWSSSSAIPAGC